MNTEQLQNQARYQTAMSMTMKLLRDGAISEDEYTEIDTIMTDKYQPFFGTLFSDIDLINQPTCV